MKIEKLADYIATQEKEYVRTAIDACEGDRARAAMALGISVATLYRKLGPSGQPTREVRKVYLIRNSRANAVKIGCSLSPGMRESTLHAQDPGLELIASWPATMLDETILQRRYALQRIRGEWFTLSDDDIRSIREYFEKATLRNKC